MLLLLVVLAGCSSGGGSSLNKSEIEAFLNTYAFHFQRLDPDSLMSLYQLPVDFYDQMGNKTTIVHESTLREYITLAMSAFDSIETILLAPPTISGSGSSATARVTAHIKATAGGIPTEATVTYEFGLQKISGQWKVRSERLISST